MVVGSSHAWRLLEMVLLITETQCQKIAQVR